MAEFLTTSGISFRLEEIIKDAQERLVIISPFLKIDRRIKELLEDRNRFKIDIRVIYGKTDLRPEESDWLESQEFIRTSFCEHLHAKCYMNEKAALLTSMNLYEFSQRNNEEMGILVAAEGPDSELYERIKEESQRLLRISENVRVTVARVADTESDNKQLPASEAKRTPKLSQDMPKAGFCIRCKVTLVANPSKPYCDTHFRSWNRFKNEDYEEKHCHFCGKDNGSSMRKPLCYTCYQQYKY